MSGNDRIKEPIRKKSGNLFHDTGINKTYFNVPIGKKS